jgi:hypothetical protein
MLKLEAINQLQTLQSILNQIEEADYKKELTILKAASIGKHVRHIIEFYECLLFSPVNETINYDIRKRNLLLEENVVYATNFITEIIDQIERIELNKRLILVSQYNGENFSMESSLYREITYNIEHTVHHLAIISMVIPLHFDYIILSKNFGYADSTIQYRKKEKLTTQ